MQRTSKRTLRWAAALCAGALFITTPAAPIFAQDKPKEEPKEEKKEDEKEEGEKEADDAKKPAGPKSGARKTRTRRSNFRRSHHRRGETVLGLFRTHQVGEKLYYENSLRHT